jgi:hypothetical protein
MRVLFCFTLLLQIKMISTNDICRDILVQRSFIWSSSSQKHGCHWQFLFLIGLNFKIFCSENISPKLDGTYMWGPSQIFLILYGYGNERGHHRQFLILIGRYLTIFYSWENYHLWGSFSFPILHPSTFNTVIDKHLSPNQIVTLF